MTELLSERENVWSILAKNEKPIAVYGMGNAAEKIIGLLNEYGAKVSAVFASDAFVRGHSFLGYRVMKYSEVCEVLGDFDIVLGFATHLPDVIDSILAMRREHRVFAPDIPVAGGGLFTYEFIRENEAHFDRVYQHLADEKSREVYRNILNFKISGKIEYLVQGWSDKEEIYRKLLCLNSEEIIADLGAYDGDTIREFTAFTHGKYRHIYALEPDAKNFKKLTKNTAGMDNITLYNRGAWSHRDTLIFDKKAGRNSKLSGSGVPVDVCDLDSLIDGEVTMIKMDIEGAELRALEGADRLIRMYHPKLYVCAYHRNEDLYSLGEKILSLGNYKLYFRQSRYLPAWECNFYAVTE